MDANGAPFEFDFDTLTPGQSAVMCNVAFGGKGASCNQSTLKSLVAKGLIEPVKNTAQDRFGALSWTTYEMPVWVHIAFCEWCSEQEAVDA